MRGRTWVKRLACQPTELPARHLSPSINPGYSTQGFAEPQPRQLAPSVGRTRAGFNVSAAPNSIDNGDQIPSGRNIDFARSTSSRRPDAGRPILFVAIEFITACKSHSRGESYRSTRWHARARLPTSWHESSISGSPKQQSKHDLSAGRRQQAAFGMIQSTQCMVRSTRYECVRVLLLGDQSFDQGS